MRNLTLEEVAQVDGGLGPVAAAGAAAAGGAALFTAAAVGAFAVGFAIGTLINVAIEKLSN